MSTLSTSTPATPGITETSPAVEVLISEKEKKSHSESSNHSESNLPAPITDPEVLAAREEADIEAGKERKRRYYLKFRPFILGGLALLILGWWISATILPATRHRWCATQLWSYCRTLTPALYIRQDRADDLGVVLHPGYSFPVHTQLRHYEARWRRLAPSRIKALLPAPVVSSPRPWLGRSPRHYIWLCVRFPTRTGEPFSQNKVGSRPSSRATQRELGTVIVLSPSSVSLSSSRACIFLLCTRSMYPGKFANSRFSEAELKGLIRPTVIVGLFIQQVIALFVLKTRAGYSIFNWIATAASDLLNCALAGAEFFFDKETINKHWFFVNVLSSIIFFIALVQMLYYVRCCLRF